MGKSPTQLMGLSLGAHSNKRAQTDCKKQTTKNCLDMYKEDAIVLIMAIIIVIFVTNGLEKSVRIHSLSDLFPCLNQ